MVRYHRKRCRTDSTDSSSVSRLVAIGYLRPAARHPSIPFGTAGSMDKGLEDWAVEAGTGQQWRPVPRRGAGRHRQLQTIASVV